MSNLKNVILISWLLNLSIKIRDFADLILWEGIDFLVFAYVLSLIFLTFVLAISIDSVFNTVAKILYLAQRSALKKRKY